MMLNHVLINTTSSTPHSTEPRHGQNHPGTKSCLRLGEFWIFFIIISHHRLDLFNIPLTPPPARQEGVILRHFPPPANKKAEPPFQEFRLVGCRHLNYLYCLAL